MIKKINNFCEKFSFLISEWAGSTGVFILSCFIILIWFISGFFCNFSDSWQLWMNSTSTIVTTIMVFLIHRASNKHSVALHLKLNELIAATDKASNRMIGIEEMSEEEVHELFTRFKKLADLANQPGGEKHSIEEIPKCINSKMKWLLDD